MFVRSLALALVVGLNLAMAAPMPYIAKKKVAPTAAELAKRFNGTYRVVSYEYGNGAMRGGLGRPIGRVLYTEVEIKEGTWIQHRDLGGRKYSNSYTMKLDTTKPIPTMSLTYPGNPEPVFFGIAQMTGNQVTVTYGTRGREVTNPFAALDVGQYKWVLERTK